MVYYRNFRHDRSIENVTNFKTVTFNQKESTGRDKFVSQMILRGQFVTGLRADSHSSIGYLRVICHNERANCHKGSSETHAI